jgi:hypothetical protein
MWPETSEAVIRDVVRPSFHAIAAGNGRREGGAVRLRTGSGFNDPPEIARMDAPRLRDEVRALDHAIERMKARPSYEEAALALLQARRRNLVSQLGELVRWGQ